MTEKQADSTILTDVYGRDAPDAAKFGKGATTLAEINQATDARRQLRPGAYRDMTPK